MKKDKRIKELDDWLKNSHEDDFTNHDVPILNEYVMKYLIMISIK